MHGVYYFDRHNRNLKPGTMYLRLKEHLKNQVNHEWFYPTATFRGLFVRIYNYDTWLVYTF